MRRTIDGWELRRLDYEGAPLEAEHVNGTIEAPDRDGDVRIEIRVGGYTECIYVPVAVLRAIIDQKETPTP